jgi:ribosomal protein S18 acetylase RimI-like enzyme
MNALIRRADADDAAPIVALMDEAATWLAASNTTSWRPGQVDADQVRAWMETGRVYVAVVAGRVVGTIRVAWADEAVWGAQPPDAGYLHSLVVARSAAGRGLGRQLVAHAEAVVRASGRPRVRLDHVRDNPRLEQWYSDAGYAVVGTHKRDSGDTVLLREKQIGRVS